MQRVESEEMHTLDTLIRGIIEMRNNFRKEKQYEMADKLRNLLSESKIRLVDTPEGTKYELY